MEWLMVTYPAWVPLVAGCCLVLLAFLGRHRECSCEKCSFHVNEHRMKREAERVKRHRETHKAFNIPWGSERCAGCRAGNERDRE